MIQMLKKIYFLLTSRERGIALLLLGQMIASSLISMFGIALIFPFMTLVLNSDLLFKQNNFFLLFFYNLFHCHNIRSFLIIFGTVVFVFLVIGNIMLGVTLWASTHFALFRNYTLSKKLLELYLFQPYKFFLNRNSSILVKNIMVEVYAIIQNVLLAFIRLLDQIITIIAILLMLLVIKPLLSFLVLLSFGGVYVIIYLLVKSRLSIISNKTTASRQVMFKIVSEGFGGIKDLKFLHREANVIKNFSTDALTFANCASTAAVIASMPRYILEIIAFGSIILVLIYLLMINSAVATIIPLLSLYVFAGYRLMPSLQQAFTYLTQIKTNQRSLDIIYDDIKCLSLITRANNTKTTLSFTQELSLEKITFVYPNAKKPAINELNLVIKPYSVTGFVGLTGAGKTTLIDIILGLLIPTAGVMKIDGLIIDANHVGAWQNNIGYVPQHIYLCDDTIANNIAFGLQSNEVDMDAVKQAAFLASLSDFIEKELPLGYDTVVGERGVRLSGGQMQRIGIARALYRNPSVLILDEATSSLDGITENAILQSIESLAQQKTVIIIAHRFSTIKECDEIFLMENGRIVDFGDYDELLKRNLDFKKMAKLK